MPNYRASPLHLISLAFFLAACASPTPTPSPSPESTFTPIATALLATATPLTPATPTPATPSPTPGDAPAIQFPAYDLIHDLHWSPDGSQLAIAAGTNIHLYNADSPSTLPVVAGQALMEQHTLMLGQWVGRIAFHPSQPILGAAAKDGSIRFWDTTSGVEICQFMAHKKGANSLAFQPNGSLLATTGTDITSRLWDISPVLAGATGDCKVKAGAFLIGSSYTAPDIEFSPDGQQFALVDIRNIYLRASQTRKLITILKSDLPIFDITISADGRWLAAAQSNATVTLWDLTAKPKPTSITLHLPNSSSQSSVWRVDFSADSSLLASAANDGALLVWELPGLQPVFSRKLSDTISGLAFRSHTRLLAVGVLDGSVYIYSLSQAIP